MIQETRAAFPFDIAAKPLVSASFSWHAAGSPYLCPARICREAVLRVTIHTRVAIRNISISLESVEDALRLSPMAYHFAVVVGENFTKRRQGQITGTPVHIGTAAVGTAVFSHASPLDRFRYFNAVVTPVACFGAAQRKVCKQDLCKVFRLLLRSIVWPPAHVDYGMKSFIIGTKDWNFLQFALHWKHGLPCAWGNIGNLLTMFSPCHKIDRASIESVHRKCWRIWRPCLHWGLIDTTFPQAKRCQKLATSCPRHLDESGRWLYFVHCKLMKLKCKYRLLSLPAPWKGVRFLHAGPTFVLFHSRSKGVPAQQLSVAVLRLSTTSNCWTWFEVHGQVKGPKKICRTDDGNKNMKRSFKDNCLVCPNVR